MNSDFQLELTSERSGWLRGGRPWLPQSDVYLVLGSPITHSLSPAIQNAALREAGRSECYFALDIQTRDIRILKQNSDILGLGGFNITHPHKRTVAELCDELSPEAVAAGVVNTVRVTENRWAGHNTDIEGIAVVLKILFSAAAGAMPRQARVLGAGGSARAAILALESLGLEDCKVHARLGPSRDSMRVWLEKRMQPSVDVRMQEWPVPVVKPRPSLTVVINTVPGTFDVTAVLENLGCGIYLDLRYGHPAEVGASGGSWITQDGLSVLLAQGAAAYRWWFDQEPSLAAMSAALSSRLG